MNEMKFLLIFSFVYVIQYLIMGLFIFKYNVTEYTYIISALEELGLFILAIIYIRFFVYSR